MSHQLQQLKAAIRQQLSPIYKDFRANMMEDDWREFESWFWKMHSLLTDRAPLNDSTNMVTQK